MRSRGKGECQPFARPQHDIMCTPLLHMDNKESSTPVHNISLSGIDMCTGLMEDASQEAGFCLWDRDVPGAVVSEHFLHHRSFSRFRVPSEHRCIGVVHRKQRDNGVLPSNVSESAVSRESDADLRGLRQ